MSDGGYQYRFIYLSFTIKFGIGKNTIVWTHLYLCVLVRLLDGFELYEFQVSAQ